MTSKRNRPSFGVLQETGVCSPGASGPRPPAEDVVRDSEDWVGPGSCRCLLSLKMFLKLK